MLLEKLPEIDLIDEPEGSSNEYAIFWANDKDFKNPGIVIQTYPNLMWSEANRMFSDHSDLLIKNGWLFAGNIHVRANYILLVKIDDEGISDIKSFRV